VQVGELGKSQMVIWEY